MALKEEGSNHWEVASWLKHSKTAGSNLLAKQNYCGTKKLLTMADVGAVRRAFNNSVLGREFSRADI